VIGACVVAALVVVIVGVAFVSRSSTDEVAAGVSTVDDPAPAPLPADAAPAADAPIDAGGDPSTNATVSAGGGIATVEPGVTAPGADLGAAPADGPPPSSTPSQALPTTSVAPRSGSWVRWNAPDGSYHLEFPSEPLSQPLPSEDPRFSGSDLVIAESGQEAYVLFALDIASGGSNPSALESPAIDGMGANLGITIADRTPGTFAGAPATSFSGTSADGNTPRSVRGVAVAKGGRVYCLMTIGTSGGAPEHERFLASFAVT
jgi:hypothetical protein